jgi:hypothetical protein
MIGGYIVRGGPPQILVRALGPPLAPFGVVDVLTDPAIEVRDPNATLVAANDNGGKPSQPPFRRLASTL